MKRITQRLLTLAVTGLSLSLSANAATTYDWTGILKNPGFESGTNFWTLDKNTSGWQDIKVVSEGAAEGNFHYNIWAGVVSSLNLHQSVTLPAGEYTLSAQLKTNTLGINDQHVYITTQGGTIKSTALTNSSMDAWETLSVNFILTGEETVVFGASSTGDGKTEKGWFCIDDFRLIGSTEPGPDMDRTVTQVSSAVKLTGSCDFHILGTVPFAEGGSIDIDNPDQAVVFFDNLRPSEARAYLKYIKILGKTAVMDNNCQLRLWDHGTVLYPYKKESNSPDGFHPLKVFAGQNCEGDSYENYGLEHTGGFMNSLTEETFNNKIRSFRLKRGYMVTFSVGPEGYGYQRCFIADSEDLVINSLPRILDGRISSYRIFRFDNIGKNGVADMMNTDDLKKLNSTWTYNWGAGSSLGTDYECVPHMNHLWSTSDYSLGANDLSPYLKTDNEPANASDPSPATVAQELARWPQLMRTGRRLLSPSSWDGGNNWHKEFYDSIDARGWRCDVTDLHCYWNEGTFGGIKGNWADKYQRPIWITEFIWGASWSGGLGIFSVATTNEERDNPSESILNQNRDVLSRIWASLIGMNYVERFAYWNGERNCSKILRDGKLTPAGEVYAKLQTGPGYTGAYEFIPRDWRCSAGKNLLATFDGIKNVCKVTWTSEDFDLCESVTLQRQVNGGEWEDVQQWIRPELLKFEIEDPVDPNNEYSYRVSVKNWKNKILTCSPRAMSKYLVNGTINSTSKGNVTGWVLDRNASNGPTKKETGDTYLEAWDETAEKIDFNYYQDITNLKEGVYSLEANCFNSSGDTGATVNGRVGLYAESNGVLYFSPVTRDSELDLSYTTKIEKIVVRNEKMRIGIRNIGRMSARWAGADNFRLNYLGTEEEVLGTDTYEGIKQAQEDVIYSILPELENGERDASGFIMNSNCNYGNTLFWTSDVATIDGQSWDADSANKYFDKYSGNSALSSSMQQNITGLPAGEYELSALLRGSNDTKITLYAMFTNATGAKKNYTTDMLGKGNTKIPGSEYENGWSELSKGGIQVTAGGKLTVTAKAANSANNSWWSADRFRLTLKKRTSGIEQISADSMPVKTIYYNMQGVQIANPTNGIYIEQTIYSNGTSKSVKKLKL